MWHWLKALAMATALYVLAAESVLAAEITVNTATDDNGSLPVECSLREAILAAILNAVTNGCAAGEAAPAVDVIKFSIPGGGVKTITVDSSQLDELLEPILIDGWSQGGLGYTGLLLIELPRGTGPGLEGAYALRVRAGGAGSTIRGLAISDWSQRTNVDFDHDDPGYGVRIDGASNVTIQGNWFGLRANGTEGGGNAADVTIVNGAQNTQVGGSTPAARNVFAGLSPGVNPDSIIITGATTTGTRIQGNYFGLSVDGTSAMAGATITLSSGAGGTVIGGNTAAERNYINVSILDFASTATANQVIGNHFGVNVNGADLPGAPSLLIGGVGTVVRGNVMPTASVGGTNAVIQGNLVGLAPDGTTVLSGGTGLTVSGTGATVGGTTAAERNVMAGSSSHGLTLAGTNLIVKGNYIGTDVTGQLARPNANGVSISGTGNQIGGPNAGERNVIAGNTGNGVRIAGSGHTIAGNLIGVAADGTTALGNGSHGVVFNLTDSNPVTIGGTTPGTGNVIANNGAAGIRNDIASRLRVSMLGNSIHSNGTLGIQLSFSPTPRANDPNDVDTGPNNVQNYPVLTSAVPGSGTAISGTLNSTANTSGYRIELFGNPTCDGSGNGEGRTFLGSAAINTDASGNGSFSTTVGATLATGTQVTATATDPQGNTSEFSQCLAVGGSGPGFVVTPTSGLVTTEAGGTATFTVRLATIPTAAVTVALTSSDPTEGTVSPATLTFQPDTSAQAPQTVTVTGLDDGEVDGAVAYTIVTAPATSSDAGYNGLNPQDVAATNQDNEVSCSADRPAVRVTSTRGAAGTLNVTVQAGSGPISQIDFGTPRAFSNASITVAGGPADQTQGFRHTPATGQLSVQFTVSAQNQGLATTVPLTVTDACGAWQTFVGGGAGSF